MTEKKRSVLSLILTLLFFTLIFSLTDIFIKKSSSYKKNPPQKREISVQIAKNAQTAHKNPPAQDTKEELSSPTPPALSTPTYKSNTPLEKEGKKEPNFTKNAGAEQKDLGFSQNQSEEKENEEEKDLSFTKNPPKGQKIEESPVYGAENEGGKESKSLETASFPLPFSKEDFSFPEGRALLYPKEPSLSLSRRAASLIKESITVRITFLVAPDGSVSAKSIQFTPRALPASVTAEIKSQIARWRFSSQEGAQNAEAGFLYTIERTSL